jgi:hypothetical protein
MKTLAENTASPTNRERYAPRSSQRSMGFSDSGFGIRESGVRKQGGSHGPDADAAPLADFPITLNPES